MADVTFSLKLCPSFTHVATISLNTVDIENVHDLCLKIYEQLPEEYSDHRIYFRDERLEYASFKNKDDLQNTLKIVEFMDLRKVNLF